MKVSKTTIATAIAAAVGASASMLPNVASAVGLADGFYDMTINNTPFTTSYQFGSDGAWSSSFTFGALPGGGSTAMYDDTIASPVNGRYAGNVGDGLQGTVKLKIEGGVITGEGGFEFDMLPGTAGGDFVEYGGSTNWTGSVDNSGNITITPTGVQGAVGDFSALVDEDWNINNFGGNAGNTAWDSFSTGSATSGNGTVNGAAWDGTSAVLVKGGSVGSDWGGFFGANYIEAWNVGFTKTGDLPTTPPTTPPEVPVPAAVWLFGSGLMGLVGVARRRKSKV